MTSYLLLRNNKESGPYSLNDLVGLGLKPYDLVWVSGKSAAWRYPSEVAELQQFAPPVEEQPFDRFFKKPAEEKKEEPIPAPAVSQPVRQTAERPVPVESQTQAAAAFTPKKSVFVTMPGQKQQQPAYKQPAYQEPAYQQYQPKVKEELTEPDYLTKTITITENPVTAEIKYSQPLDEIKEMYVKTLQERKQRIANKVVIIQGLKKIAVVLCIVGAGVVIGFFLKSNGGKNNQVASTQALPAVSQPAVSSTLPETNTNVADQQASIGDKSNEQQKQPVDETTKEEIQEDIKRIPLVKKESEPVVTDKEEEQPAEEVLPKAKKESAPPKQKEVSIDEPSPGVDVNDRTGERSRKVRSGTPSTTYEDEEARQENTTGKQENTAAKPKAVMSNSNKSLSKLVSVTSNEYQRVAFGGIRNLQLTVLNDSKYILDNVVVELQYLKPSEEPLRVEMIPFRNVSPGGAMTIRIPDTNRGIKVRYKIVHILSTQSAKDMADL